MNTGARPVAGPGLEGAVEDEIWIASVIHTRVLDRNNAVLSKRQVRSPGTARHA